MENKEDNWTMAVTAKTIQVEKGYPLLLGANRWNEGYNFAVEISEET